MHDPFTALPTRRETHLLKNPLQMRLPISPRLRNQLKNSHLRCPQLQLHTPGQMRPSPQPGPPHPIHRPHPAHIGDNKS